MLDSVLAASDTKIVLQFRQVNGTKQYSYLDVRDADFRDIVYRHYEKEIKVYDDYKAAMAEVKRLNAAEQEKQK